MYRLTPQDVEYVTTLREQGNPIGIRWEARRQFLITTDETGQPTEQVIRDGPQAGRARGLVHPFASWDNLPPLSTVRQRDWVRGVPYIRALDPGAEFDHIPETLWSAIEGGRPVVTPEDARQWPMDNRMVEFGQCDNGLFTGREADRLRISRCSFRNCNFYNTVFRRVDFLEVSFHGCNFASCRFEECAVVSCHFDYTSWGDPRAFPRRGNANGVKADPTYYNTVRANQVQGAQTTDHARGYGPALFMSPEEVRTRNAEVVGSARRGAPLVIWRLPEPGPKEPTA